MKSGWKTTEFWVTVFSIVGMAAAALASSLGPRYAAIAVAISSAAYALSRGLAKQHQPKGTA